jgi:periplasmic divalent cation tolerance protein
MGAMKSKALMVMVTAPDVKTARKLAKAALEARLVACANLVPRLESHYWWQGKLAKGAEVLILFKTGANHIKSLEKLVVSLHPYDTPEFVSLPVGYVNRRFQTWWDDCLRS